MSSEDYEGFVNTISKSSPSTHSESEGLKAFLYIWYRKIIIINKEAFTPLYGRKAFTVFTDSEKPSPSLHLSLHQRQPIRMKPSLSITGNLSKITPGQEA